MNETIMPTIDARQDTLAAPALVMIAALRRAIEASGAGVDAERILTVTLYVATAQSANVCALASVKRWYKPTKPLPSGRGFQRQ